MAVAASWKDMVLHRIDKLPNCTPKMRNVLREYTVDGPKRASERFSRAVAMSSEVGWPVRFEQALDLGCGTGGGLAILSEHFEHVVGCDIDRENLDLARKFVEEKKLRNVDLVLSNALTLPFPDNTFDFVTGLDVLHHMPEPSMALAEIYRILKPGGVLAMDSANRFSLFSLEPHVKLWGVGFLPRSLQGKYVKWFLGVSYAEQNAKLLSLRELHRCLGDSFGQCYRLYSPFLWKAAPKKFGGIIRFFRNYAQPLSKLGHLAFLVLMSNHEFLAQKAKP